MPSGEIEGEFPSGDSREEVDALVGFEIGGLKVEDASVIDFPWRDVAGIHEVLKPVADEALVVVVEGERHSVTSSSKGVGFGLTSISIVAPR